MLLKEVSHGYSPVRKWWWSSWFYSTTVHVGVHALVGGNDNSAAVPLRNWRSERTNWYRRVLPANICWKTRKCSWFPKWYKTITFILFLKKCFCFCHHWSARYLWKIVERVWAVFRINCGKKIRSFEHIRRFNRPYIRFCKILWFSFRTIFESNCI